jgi:hypothetical protein
MRADRFTRNSWLRPALATLAIGAVVLGSTALGGAAYADEIAASGAPTERVVAEGAPSVVATDPAAGDVVPAEPSTDAPVVSTNETPDAGETSVSEAATEVAPGDVSNFFATPPTTPPESAPPAPVVPSPTAPVFSKTPRIVGQLIAGETLTVDFATLPAESADTHYYWAAFSSYGDDDFAYREIGTASSVLVTPDLVGLHIRVFFQVDFDNARPLYGEAVTATTVTALPQDFRVLDGPAISGSTTVGSVLTVSPGTYTSKPDTITYQWYANFEKGDSSDVLLPGSTGTTLVVDGDLYVDPVTTTIWAEVVATYHGVALPMITNLTKAVEGTRVVDLTNSVAPTLVGSADVGSTLTVDPGKWSTRFVYFTYDWFIARGQSGDELSDTGPTHVITQSDVGGTVGVVITAYAVGKSVETTLERAVNTPDVAPPAPSAPFATDASITPANQGGITGEVRPNKSILLTVSADPGDVVYVYGYSTPMLLGAYTVDANRQISVDYSALPAGSHHLVVVDAGGALLGWYGVSVAASASGTAALAVGTSAAKQLAHTGLSYSADTVTGATGILLLAGILMALFSRLGRRKVVVAA